MLMVPNCKYSKLLIGLFILNIIYLSPQGNSSITFNFSIKKFNKIR